jgi:hypothetical protein
MLITASRKTQSPSSAAQKASRGAEEAARGPVRHQKEFLRSM